MKKLIVLIILLQNGFSAICQIIPSNRNSDIVFHPAAYLSMDSIKTIEHYDTLDPSVPTTNPQLRAYSSLSDAYGDLMLYTNGDYLYNGDHKVVNLGDRMVFDDYGIANTAIIPSPRDSNKVYIFHTNTPGKRGFFYTVYDRVAKSVVPTQMNIKLCDSISYGVCTAVRASNNVDWWVIFFINSFDTHSDQALAFRFSPRGIETPNVISALPLGVAAPMEQRENFQQSLGAKFFAFSQFQCCSTYIAPFDNHLGLFDSTSGIRLEKSTENVAISPLGCNLFGKRYKKDTVFCWHLGSHISPDPKLGGNVFNDPNFNNIKAPLPENMILGYNGFIHYQYRLNIIRFGNTDDSIQDISVDTVSLTKTKNDINRWYYTEAAFPIRVFHKLLPTVRNFTYHGQCLPDTTHFTYIDNHTYCVQYDSLRWKFGDPSSGTKNTSTLTYPSHLYSDTGEYFVQLFKYNGSDIDTITNWVTISKYPELEVPSDTVICTASDVVLRLSINDESYHHWLTYDWNGKPSKFIRVTKSDTLIARAMNQLTCETKDTVIVQFSDLPKPTSAAYHICLDDTLVVNLKQGATYANWGSDSSDVVFSTTDPGKYLVRWQDSLGCSATDTFTVTQSEKLEISPNHDTTVCRNESVLYTIPPYTQNILWNNGDTLRTFVGRGEGPVMVSFTDTFNCPYHDSVYLYMNDSVPMADFTFPETCMNTSVNLKASGEVNGLSNTYQWIIGKDTFNLNEISYIFTKPGTQEIRLKITAQNGCSDTTVKQVNILPKPFTDFKVNDVCHGDSVFLINQSVVPSGYQTLYFWKLGDGNTDSAFSPKHFYELSDTAESQTFVVTLKAFVKDGCADSLFKTATVNPLSNPYFEASIKENVMRIDSQATVDAEHIYLWDFGDSTNSSVITPTHTYNNLDTNGYQICLKLINPAGCVSQYCVFEKPVLGIFTPSIQQIKIVPNPADESFELMSENYQKVYSIHIVNQQGQLVKKFDNGGRRYDISELVSGVYQVRILSELGFQICTLVVI